MCLLYVYFSGHPAAAQQPASTQQTTEQPPATTPPPPPVIAPAGDFYAGVGFSITVHYWLGTGHPIMGTGHGNGNEVSSALDFLGKPRPSPEAIVSIPAGKHSAIRVSYFRIQGSGNPTAPTPLIIFGTSFAQGDYLATHYNLQTAKISLDYLSWPFPVKDSKFHVKTLWEVLYTNIGSSVDAPLRHGQTDASGAPIITSGYGKDWLIFPSFGLGVDYLASHNFRFEGRASGFIFPHRSTVYDVEGTLNYRFGKFEVQGGAKIFHFKTSPERVEFLYGTFPGVFAGLRWYPRYSKM